MQFIRDNLFYVVLVSAVLLITGVIVAIGASVSGDADDQLVKRTGAQSTLDSLQRDLPTVGAVEAEKARVAKVDVQAKRVEEATLKWNRGEYPMFETQDFKVGDKPFPAFSVDPQAKEMTTEKWAKWRKDNTDWQKDSYSEHTGAYISLMTKLVLEDLRSTTPPAPSAIAKEREARLLRLKNERGDKEQGEVRSRLGGAARTGRDVSPARGGEDVRAVHRIVSHSETPEVRAEIDAKTQLAVAQSEQGYVYADLRAFNPVFVERQSIMLPGDRVKLWGAWVHYRVSRDIAFAVRNTIADVLKAGGKDLAKATVPESPIKRLQDVMINPLPYMGGTVAFGEARGSSAGGSPAQGKTGGATSLTGRVSNAQYDVIRYQFTVVMADKYVGQLIESLYRQNDHFVLSFRMEPVETGGSARAGGAAAEATDESLCNYGVDPVMRVTFDCELLMRTGWCRDLMPEDVLAVLKSAPGVLRPQDIERLSRASGARRY